KLFIDAHARINVPSTEKCSSDRRSCHSANCTPRSKNIRPIRSFSVRSRWTPNVEGSHTSSSRVNPTNHRYNRLNSISSTNRRSEREQNLDQTGTQQPLRRGRCPPCPVIEGI